MSSTTNEKETIRSISILFSKVISRQFYDKFIENYGEPNHTYIIENRKEIIEEPEEENDFARNAKKFEGDLREGSFDENPLYIIWEKENYTIRAFLRHEQNISEITFKVK
ncbi:hypothetical protein MHTCC0001_35900 [Flavobacteriaceae bacterium MHTCC 0001]